MALELEVDGVGAAQVVRADDAVEAARVQVRPAVRHAHRRHEVVP